MPHTSTLVFIQASFPTLKFRVPVTVNCSDICMRKHVLPFLKDLFAHQCHDVAFINTHENEMGAFKEE